jgi:hypothetical protein
VFVSSSLEELSDERRAVREAVESMRMTPVMFELGARSYAPRALYHAYLEQSDVFVGADELRTLVADDRAVLLKERFEGSAARPDAPARSAAIGRVPRPLTRLIGRDADPRPARLCESVRPSPEGRARRMICPMASIRILTSCSWPASVCV